MTALFLTIVALVFLSFLLTYINGLVGWCIGILGFAFILSAILHSYFAAVNSGKRKIPDIVFGSIMALLILGVYLVANTKTSRNMFDDAQAWTLKKVASEKMFENVSGFIAPPSTVVALHVEDDIPYTDGIQWRNGLLSFPPAPNGFSWGIQVEGKRPLLVQGQKHLLEPTVKEVKVFYVDLSRNKSSKARTITIN